MKVKDSLILSRVPEYLVRQKSDSVEGELIENLNPNTINLVASLIEKILENTGDYNFWNDFDKYSPEFRMDEVLGELDGLFSISQPELLKGFFKSKGTANDIRFVLKNLGFDLNIYEADFYHTNKSLLDIMKYRYTEIFQDFLDNGYDGRDIDEILGRTIYKVNNNSVRKVDNNNPIKVINTNITGSEFFAVFDYEPTSDQLDKFSEILRDYLDSKLLDYSNIDCTITADVRSDLDSHNFSGIRLGNITTLLRAIVANRLSACISLRRFGIFAEMKDFYSTKVSNVLSIAYEIGKTYLDYRTGEEYDNSNIRLSKFFIDSRISNDHESHDIELKRSFTTYYSSPDSNNYHCDYELYRSFLDNQYRQYDDFHNYEFSRSLVDEKLNSDYSSNGDILITRNRNLKGYSGFKIGDKVLDTRTNIIYEARIANSHIEMIGTTQI